MLRARAVVLDLLRWWGTVGQGDWGLGGGVVRGRRRWVLPLAGRPDEGGKNFREMCVFLLQVELGGVQR